MRILIPMLSLNLVGTRNSASAGHYRAMLLIVALLLALTPITLSAQDAETSAEATPAPQLAFYENQREDFSGLVPAGWRQAGNAYLRLASAEDLTGVLIFSAQDAEPRELLRSWLLRAGIPDIGEQIGPPLSGQYLTWTLHRSIAVVSDIEAFAVFDIALAQDTETGRSFAVVLQSNAQERDTLFNEVLLPMLFYIAPGTGLYDAEIVVERPPEATPAPPPQPYSVAESGLSLLVPPGWTPQTTNRYTVLTHDESGLRYYFMLRDGDDINTAIEVALRLIDPGFNLTPRIDVEREPPAGATGYRERFYTEAYDFIITAFGWQSENGVWVGSTQGDYRPTTNLVGDIRVIERSFIERTLVAP
jgi:hypothetical protein